MARLKRRRSPFGQFLYNLRYRVGEFWLRGFVAGMRYIPFRVVERFTTTMAWVSFMLMSQYRRRMQENIALTLGKDIHGEAERKDLAWRAWKSFARVVLDTMAILHHSNARIVGSIRTSTPLILPAELPPAAHGLSERIGTVHGHHQCRPMTGAVTPPTPTLPARAAVS